MRLLFTFILIIFLNILNGQDPIFKQKQVLVTTNTTDWYDIYMPCDINDDGVLEFFGLEQQEQVLYYSENNLYKTKILNSYLGYPPITYKDFNGDDKKDFLVDRKTYYKNIEVDSFNKASMEAGSYSDRFTAFEDIDGDGLVDVVSVIKNTFSNDELTIYYNKGNDIFEQVIINSDYYHYGYVKVLDINNDGLLDVATFGNGPSVNEAVFFVNNGDKTFTKSIFKLGSFVTNECLELADLDNDGDKDLLVLELDNYIKVFEKNGNSFVEHNDVGLVKMEFCKTADIDNDGDLDIIGMKKGDNHELIVYYTLNEGDFNFKQPIIMGEVPGWTTIGWQNSNFMEHWFSLIDVNNDKSLDVVLNSPLDQSIYWFENNTVVSSTTSINLQPISQNICEGEDVTFVIGAVGSDLTYQWQKDGTDIAGAIDSFYTINNVSLSDAGIYRCSVISSSGSVTSDNATLTVKEQININSQPNSSNKIEGGSCTFSVSASGTISTYKWYKEGTELADGADISGVSTSTLVISNLKKSDAGDYTCKVSGECNEILSSIAKLKVYKETKITTQPSSIEACEKESVIFSIDASGDNITYQWSKDGTNISGANTQSYTINSVVLSDGGVYKCKVKADGGDKVSSGATLTVNKLIQITSQPQSLTLNQGKEAKFNTVAIGTISSYQWQKDNSPISDGGNISGATTTELSITNITTSDKGNYTVKISGACGDKVSDIATLDVTTATIDLINAGITISPNPSSDYINIQNTGKGIDKIEIYNQTGQLLIQKSKDFGKINVANLVSGVYFIKVIQGEDIGIGKIVVDKR